MFWLNHIYCNDVLRWRGFGYTCGLKKNCSKERCCFMLSATVVLCMLIEFSLLLKNQRKILAMQF